jgi:hypothetical protein
MFASVQKLLQISMLFLAGYRVCSPLFVWVAARLLHKERSVPPGSERARPMLLECKQTASTQGHTLIILLSRAASGVLRDHGPQHRGPWIPAFFLVLYNGKMDDEGGRRINGRSGVSGLVVGLLVVIIILLVLLLLQLGFFSGFFVPSQPQVPQSQPKQEAPQSQPKQEAPQDQPNQQQAPQNQPNQQPKQAPQDQQPKQNQQSKQQ